MINIKEIFGSNLRKEREKRELSQEKLAEMLEIGIPALSKIECGKSYPKPRTLEKIIDVLNIQPQDLFHTENEISLEAAYNETVTRLKKIKSNKKLILKAHRYIMELTCQGDN